MGEDIELDKKIFLPMAKAFGLDTRDPHGEELYAYTRNVFRDFKVTEDIDLTDLEPMATSVLPKE